MISSIFFSFFDVEEGPKVLHQVPPSSIDPSPSPDVNSPPLFSFPTVSQYLIPASTLSNQPLQLLSPTKPYYRLLSHPITIESSRYARNAFTFNFVVVLREDIGHHTYLPVASKLASLFRHLEEHERFLSVEIARAPERNTGRIYSICEQVLEDLNNYSECMIPIDGTTTTINIKLFPIYAPPPPLYAWQVPLLTVDLEGMMDPSWDLTMLRILPYIDGVRSVKRIAAEADADFKLVRKAIRHLLYYGCATLLDVFSFSAIYAPTESMAVFVEDEVMQEECLNHVQIPELPGVSRSLPQKSTVEKASKEEARELDALWLVELYLSLRQGQQLRSWVLEHGPHLPNTIDVRRFITFGVLNGFLYRVHKYALATSAIPVKGRDKQSKPTQVNDQALDRFLNGTHCFDEICTELMISEKELMRRMKAYDGDVQVICR